MTMEAARKTPLDKLQKDIDRCNNRRGCDSSCSLRHQANCSKLKAHEARRDYCREQGMEIWQW